MIHLLKNAVSSRTNFRPRGGGGGVLVLEMGKGDPVPIRLSAKKTPCPNLEINTEFI